LFQKKYNKEIEAYIENKYYYNQLKKQKGAGVKLINKKIDLKLLSKLLEQGEIIVYLDCYYLYKILHAPHFVVALKQGRDIMEIADPGDGKIKKISLTTIKKGIYSLRSHLKYSHVLVTFSD